MTTFFLDLEQGNDANDGLSFAQRWLTLTTGAAAAIIAPGDTIRIKRSPSPTNTGIDATWNDNSASVTLASALTLNVSDCSSNWTVSTNVTQTSQTTTRKEGTSSRQFAFGSAFLTGKAAYFPLGAATDYSAFQQLSLWIFSSTAIPAGRYSLRLCSDATGDVTVNTFAIPAIASTSWWNPITIDLGGAMGNSIQSVALYCDTDPGTQTVIIDNIVACKAPSDPGSLSLTSLISKNVAGEWWWAIRSISANGLTLTLDSRNGSVATTPAVYSAPATETVALWKREPINVPAARMNLAEGGSSADSRITVSGGWDSTDMSTQPAADDTIIECAGHGLATTEVRAASFSLFERIGVVRSQSSGFGTLNVTDLAPVFRRCQYINGNSGGFLSPGRAMYLENVAAIQSTTPVGTSVSVFGKGLYLQGNTGGVFSTSMLTCDIQDIDISGNRPSTGALINFNDGMTLRNMTARNMGQLVFGAAGGKIFGGIYEFVTGSFFLENVARLYVHNGDFLAQQRTTSMGLDQQVRYGKALQVVDDHKIVSLSSTIQTDAAIRHTESDFSWKFALSSPDTMQVASIEMPIAFPLGRFAVSANALVTISAWMRRSSLSGHGRLVVKSYQIAGVTNDVVSPEISAAVDTWEQLTLTFTPTESGVVEVEAHVWATVLTTNLWIDDVAVSQA